MGNTPPVFSITKEGEFVEGLAGFAPLDPHCSVSATSVLTARNELSRELSQFKQAFTVFQQAIEKHNLNKTYSFVVPDNFNPRKYKKETKNVGEAIEQMYVHLQNVVTTIAEVFCYFVRQRHVIGQSKTSNQVITRIFRELRNGLFDKIEDMFAVYAMMVVFPAEENGSIRINSTKKVFDIKGREVRFANPTQFADEVSSFLSETLSTEEYAGLPGRYDILTPENPEVKPTDDDQPEWIPAGVLEKIESVTPHPGMDAEKTWNPGADEWIELRNAWTQANVAFLGSNPRRSNVSLIKHLPDDVQWLITKLIAEDVNSKRRRVD